MWVNCRRYAVQAHNIGCYKTQQRPWVRQLEATYDVIVKECGLFVDQKRPFLGATPDGLVGDDTLVEMKCPYAARDLTPLEGVRKKKKIL
ncbi:hypothetical protein HPB48_025011 [Haemaphysalis longicornis]|uniref:YqaJ viral recombinase domain-containing protein n=1 Tax=Haemaphysalis longicornis TaxID=44386 RepID=A0A9J6H982_HAELO|nr:hypothetical protein HPB48_025011 [Haemaphysalis longicornis]